jgi:hypothetical protein
MSRLEKAYLYLKRRDPEAVQLREQVPCFPIEETDGIARSLGIRPLRTPHGKPYMVTTDLLLRMRNGAEQAHFVRPLELLKIRREWEKMQVEKEYWTRRGLVFQVVTEAQVPEAIMVNLEILQDNQFPPEGFQTERHQAAGLAHLRVALDGGSDMPLTLVCRNLDIQAGMRTGTYIALIKHLLFRRTLTTNLYTRFKGGQPYRIEGTQLVRMESG